MIPLPMGSLGCLERCEGDWLLLPHPEQHWPSLMVSGWDDNLEGSSSLNVFSRCFLPVCLVIRSGRDQGFETYS